MKFKKKKEKINPRHLTYITSAFFEKPNLRRVLAYFNAKGKVRMEYFINFARLFVGTTLLLI